MKKLISICAAVIMAVSLFACGTSANKTRIANVPYSTTRTVRRAPVRTTTRAKRSVAPETRNTTARSTTKNGVTRSTVTNRAARGATNDATRNATMYGYMNRNAAIPNPAVRSLMPYTLPGAAYPNAPLGAPVYTGRMTPFNVAN